MTELHRPNLADDFHSAPLDAELRASIEGQGLGIHRVADDDRTGTDRWLDAVSRGFLDPEREDKHREAFFERAVYRRKLGVTDATGPDAAVPVATFGSWGADLTVPGGATVPACAISSVTVAPTHRRRGLLRSIMAGELRTAAGLGFPLAVLTVSESSIYGRFGFAPAAHAAHWKIDTRRARWIGPEPEGRIDFVTREQGRALAPALHDRIRVTSPGEIDMPGGHWDRFFGTRPDAEKAGERRVAQYTSATGEVEGLVIYAIGHNHDDFTLSTVDVHLLLAATDAAYAALWRFVLSMDLIGTVTAGQLSLDEPLWWMIADQRAATITSRDHQYVRILDVPAALSARSYDVTDTVAFEVSDPFGTAEGVFVLSAGDEPAVDVADEAPIGVPLVRLGVAELSALLLGGVSAVSLAKAGRLDADDPARIARVFGSTVTPRLSFWY